MINIVDLSHHFGVRPVLQNINMRVQPGELVAVMGPNGVGKSTLLSAVAGIFLPHKGHIEIEGIHRRSSPENELAIRKKLVYLSDHPWLPLAQTGREWLLAVGRLYDVDPDHLMDHMDRLLSLFNLADQGDAPMHTYFNGQKKKSLSAPH